MLNQIAMMKMTSFSAKQLGYFILPKNWKNENCNSLILNIGLVAWPNSYDKDDEFFSRPYLIIFFLTWIIHKSKKGQISGECFKKFTHHECFFNQAMFFWKNFGWYITRFLIELSIYFQEGISLPANYRWLENQWKYNLGALWG